VQPLSRPTPATFAGRRAAPAITSITRSLQGLPRWSGPPRKHRVEDAPAPRLAVEAHRTALRFGEAAGQREPQPRAPVLLRGATLELLEVDEQAPDVLLRDADTAVLDLDAESVRALGPRSHHDAAALGRELEGVREVIVEDLAETRRVDRNVAEQIIG